MYKNIISIFTITLHKSIRIVESWSYTEVDSI